MEKNYYPIEVEMLAVTWAIEREDGNVCTWIARVSICTDHQPSVPILNYKTLVEMSPRIQSLDEITSVLF